MPTFEKMFMFSCRKWRQMKIYRRFHLENGDLFLLNVKVGMKILSFGQKSSFSSRKSEKIFFNAKVGTKMRSFGQKSPFSSRKSGKIFERRHFRLENGVF
jgi:hypothetical protein